MAYLLCRWISTDLLRDGLDICCLYAALRRAETEERDDATFTSLQGKQ